MCVCVCVCVCVHVCMCGGGVSGVGRRVFEEGWVWSVCVWGGVGVCVCVCVWCVCVCVCVCACMHMWVWVFEEVCVWGGRCVCVCARACACMHMCVHVFIHLSLWPVCVSKSFLFIIARLCKNASLSIYKTENNGTFGSRCPSFFLYCYGANLHFHSVLKNMLTFFRK